MTYCELCGGSGTILAERICDGVTFAFRCSCENGRRHPRDPDWNQSRFAEYKPEFAGKPDKQTVLRTSEPIVAAPVRVANWPDHRMRAAGEREDG